MRQRPQLDGRLDDACWKSAKAAALASPLDDDAQWPAVVMFAHDDEYLYIGIRCRRAAGAHYEATAGTRVRDTDLSDHDRVDIFLDLDRTYATYYRLTIDHRGWAADSCSGDVTWNPNWFIAARTDDETWSAEAAIPWRELGTEKATGRSGRNLDPLSKPVWAIGIQRTVPGVGFQSWSTPASTRVMPEGFGFLMIE